MAVTEPELSIVVPLFDEESNVAELGERLLRVLRGLDATSELVFVDDGSRDSTLERLRTLQSSHHAVRVVVLARNAGQHAAVLAGFGAARGAFVVTLDADLQNPPEEIPRLLACFRAGHDLVATVRRHRDDAWFRRRASAAVNAWTRKSSGIPLRDFGCMLRGYSREITRVIVERDEPHTFIPALGYVLARNPVEIDVAHAARGRGRSKYSLVRLFRLHLDLMTGFSLEPLRLLFPVGSVIAALGMVCGITLLVLRLVHGPAWAVDGMFTVFAVLFFFVGAQFVALGLLGEYVGRVLLAVRARPTHVVREILGAESDASPDADAVPPSARRVQAHGVRR
jgi:undecaprenyl-phosphate 4-deoxy-4-formamido-L-arabinose transferase